MVVVYLEGGADSFNMVVPHSGCKGFDIVLDFIPRAFRPCTTPRAPCDVHTW